MDNYSGSGTYYQIPTLSYSNLDYGTYKLRITAGKVSNTQGTRATYYIDGIRVYNPIQNLESDADVMAAYGEKELGAKFVNAKDLLADGSTAFIDQIFHIFYTENGNNTYITNGTDKVELIRGGEYDAATGRFLDPDDNAVEIVDRDGRLLTVTPTDTEPYSCEITDTAINIVLPTSYGLTIEDGGETTGDYNTSQLSQVAPSNEVYLAPGQGISIKTSEYSANYYYVGMKALEGTPTAEIMGEDGKESITIGHTTDLYYRVVPESGFINITNKTGGTGKLAITKIRATSPRTRGMMTSAAPFSQITEEDDVLSNFRAFRAAPVFDASPIALEEEEIEEQEKAAEEQAENVDEQAEDTDEGKTGVTVLTGDDIVIENTQKFDAETAAEAKDAEVKEPEVKENKTAAQNDVAQILSKLFKGIRSLFKR